MDLDEGTDLDLHSFWFCHTYTKKLHRDTSYQAIATLLMTSLKIVSKFD